MSSILRKAMLPVALAVAMAAFIGAFGNGVSGIRDASAIDGDICAASTNAPAAGSAGAAFHFDHPVDFVVTRGTTYGLVFRIEDEHGENVRVRIDSETGSGRITSKAEILSVEHNARNAGTQAAPIWFDAPNVGHILVTSNTGTQVVDTMSPRFFNDADGHEMDNINDWLLDVGYTGFANISANSVCGSSSGTAGDGFPGDDGWGFIDFQCIQSGYFHIDIETPDDTEETGLTLKFFCFGQAETATLAASRTTVEIQPTNVAPGGFGQSVITVTVLDQFGNRIDGVAVTFVTDNCQFRNTGGGYAGAPGIGPAGGLTSIRTISPAGGGTTVTTHTDTEATGPDQSLLTDNPLQHAAGTAEVVLDCTLPGSTPGTANVRAIVERVGANIVLTQAITVIGPTSATGLTLTLSPTSLECGQVVRATARAVDATGAAVSPGTEIFFTTDTTSGIIGGLPAGGAQGVSTTINGEAVAHIATDPSKPGIHTVIAYVVNRAGTPSAQVAASYTCDAAVAPVVPTVPAPSTGTGSITPPSTGDAGLASASSSASLFVLAGAVAFVLAGLASVRFARN